MIAIAEESLNIDENRIHLLLAALNNYSMKNAIEKLQISESTLRRWRRMYNIKFVNGRYVVVAKVVAAI